MHTSPLTALAPLLMFAAPLTGADDVNWKPLSHGKTPKNSTSASLAAEPDVTVEHGATALDRGSTPPRAPCTAGDFPKTNYEVVREGKRVNGIYFFCTTTFAVGDTHCSLVVGGWAGAVVGLSSIDGKDASENATRKNMGFDNNKWYKVKIR